MMWKRTAYQPSDGQLLLGSGWGPPSLTVSQEAPRLAGREDDHKSLGAVTETMLMDSYRNAAEVSASAAEGGTGIVAEG